MIGPVFQLGYLVSSLEEAMAHWTQSYGVGPFFVLPPRRFAELSVDGEPTDQRDMIAGVALAYFGDLQIELIVPGPAPSTYHRFLDAGGSGLHHLGLASADFDGDRAALLARGAVPETEGRTDLTRFSYLRGVAPYPGTVVELVEMNQRFADALDMMKAAAKDWDGQDPIRQL